MNRAPALLIALLCAPLALAKPERSFGPWYFGLSGGAVQQLRSDLDDSPGDFSVTRWFIQPSVGYAWSRSTSVSLAVGAGESSYKFSDEVNIAGDPPWDRIRDYRVSIPVRFAIGERFSGIVIPSIRSYAEASADLADGRSEGLITGVSWQLGKPLRGGQPSAGRQLQALGNLPVDDQNREHIGATTDLGEPAEARPQSQALAQLPAETGDQAFTAPVREIGAGFGVTADAGNDDAREALADSETHRHRDAIVADAIPGLLTGDAGLIGEFVG